MHKRVVLRRHGRTVHVLRSVRRLVHEQLTMPTTIVGQNGAQIKQSTRISVNGCPKAKRSGTKSKAKHSKTKGKKH
jgi:hypothetical protein